MSESYGGNLFGAKYFAIEIVDRTPPLKGRCPIILGPYDSAEHQKVAIRLARCEGREVYYLDAKGSFEVGMVPMVDGGTE